MFNGVQDLKENTLDHVVLTNILATLRYIVEQVSFGAELQDHIDAIRVIDNLVHGNNIGMGGSHIVESKFSALEVQLSPVQWGSIGIKLAERLDGILDASGDVDGQIHYAIGTGTDNFY